MASLASPHHAPSQHFTNLLEQLSAAANEDEVRHAWLRALEGTLDILFHSERGHRDLSYNNVVIEFKGPGKFRNGIASPAFREALDDRLLPYIRSIAKEQNIPESDYIGIAIDDSHVAFAQVVNGQIITHSFETLTPTTFHLVAQACRTSYRRALTASNLIEDFGHTSHRGIALMGAMAQALQAATANSKKIAMLFEEWRTLYGQVADLSPEQLKGINGTLRFARAQDTTEIPARLFVVHTYNSLLIKLLAAEIVAAHGLASASTFVGHLAAIEDHLEIIQRMRADIEDGGLFDATGIHGFVEEPIFAWYLDADIEDSSRSDIAIYIRDILAHLSFYRTDSLDHTQDVLRDFYQDLVPELLRKTLGEFYTPEWLVNFTLNQADITDWLNIRAIDPTCGSGTFLVEMIQRKKAQAASVKLSAERTVEMVLKSVWGFDLNPLAVQASRTNYLMAIADLLKASPGQQIEIPVLLADAVYSPARLPDSEEGLVKYHIGSQIADLRIVLPAELAFDRGTLDQVFEVMGELVNEDAEYEVCEQALVERRVISRQQLLAWTYPLRLTYEQVLKLHRQRWNGIWFRIVRNFFWSATAGEFDLIVGNPPWVRWSKLPEAYRDRAKSTCEQYDIFSETPHHGGNELDISGMITYTTSDKWLRPGGTVAFVITQTHFQSPSSQGFRRFRIDPRYRLAPLSVDDMKALKPFPEAANKTSVAIFRKQIDAPEYPVPYRAWTASEGFTRAIPPTLAINEVLDRVNFQDYEANPVGADGSPWTILPPGRFPAIASIRGQSDWVRGRKGITTDLNAVYFVRVESTNESNGLVRVSTRPEAGRTNIGMARTFWVEPILLYPLLKGASDFETCYLNPSDNLFTFIPNSGITSQAYADADHLMVTSCPKTRRYFNAYEYWLRNRSTWSKRMPNAPFYAIYNVGSYTFAPYKVIWAEQSGTFEAAVATTGEVPVMGQREYVPDHKIFFVDFQEAEPAYFLCGLLASPIVQEFVESHNISIQVGDIFKHMSVPSFDCARADHRRLAWLVQLAHEEHDASKRAALVASLKLEAEQIIDAGVL